VTTIKPEIREDIFILIHMHQTHLQVSMSTVNLKRWNSLPELRYFISVIRQQ